MSRDLNAIRIGIRRGWTMFRHLMTTADGIGNQVFWNGIPLIILILNRNTEVEGTTIPFAALALPGFIGLAVAAAAYNPAYYIAAEREDGTILRARAVPHGIAAYVTGVLTQSVLETGVTMAVLLIPGYLLLTGLIVPDAAGWMILVGVTVFGLLATLPIGVIIGSVIRSARLIGAIGLLVIGGMTVISGIFIPLQAFPTWLQVVAQAFPVYWIGLAMRSVFLPDAAMALELGGSWRTLETFVVLLIWSVAGALIAPILLRRMTRRATGAAVEASRQQALQRL
jgi:ABC-2 type transport system permease protein